ncbi:MAG TPA: hypothetical protein VE569_04635 [Acidimicrobiia bacterium]|jgi:hypothetical protein|nr:hypothetical protein [Acidimicrobiia bacterium]
MNRTGRNALLVALIAVVVASFSLTVLAAQGDEGSDEEVVSSTTTTVDTGLTPAVEVSDNEAAEPPADWTYRYIIPTGLALAAVVIVITAIKYFTDVVRKRYRIVQE